MDLPGAVRGRLVYRPLSKGKGDCNGRRRNPRAAVYLIAVHNVTDPEQLQQYLDEVFAIGG